MWKRLALTLLLFATPALADTAWGPTLSGKHLSLVRGAEARTDIYLLPGGQFAYSRDTAVAPSGTDGEWSVQGDRLVLQFRKGATRSYQLSGAADQVALNGVTFDVQR